MCNTHNNNTNDENKKKKKKKMSLLVIAIQACLFPREADDAQPAPVARRPLGERVRLPSPASGGPLGGATRSESSAPP